MLTTEEGKGGYSDYEGGYEGTQGGLKVVLRMTNYSG